MIRYGIIGCGGHAFDAHALPGKDVPELSLVSICDTNPEAMARFSEKYGENLSQNGDMTALLNSGIDAVVIATPDEFHIENIRQAVAMNKHVLVEKPLAVDREQLYVLRNILNEAAKKKLVITSCHPRRFDPPFVWLKEHTASHVDELGKVIEFNFDFSYHQPTEKWKASRSLMLDHLNHEIDLLHFLYGAESFTAECNCDGFDRYLVTGMRLDEITFRFHGTRRLETRVFMEWARVRHERGEVEVDAHSGTARITSHETGLQRTEACGKTDYPLRFRKVMENFAGAILGTAENYLTPEDLWINNWTGVELFISGSMANVS